MTDSPIVHYKRWNNFIVPPLVVPKQFELYSKKSWIIKRIHNFLNLQKHFFHILQIPHKFILYHKQCFQFPQKFPENFSTPYPLFKVLYPPNRQYDREGGGIRWGTPPCQEGVVGGISYPHVIPPSYGDIHTNYVRCGDKLIWYCQYVTMVVRIVVPLDQIS